MKPASNPRRFKGLFAPQLKVGGKIYYRRSELETWLDARAVGGDGRA
jgi:hypothetical protein